MGIRREQLYEEIWAEPMTTVAKRYDLSSSFLARVCERLKVPRPPRGYWPQLKVGKVGPRPPLPAAEPGDELEWVRDGSSPARQPMVAVAGARKRQTPARSDGKHPLLVGVREDFEKGRVSRYDSEKYLRPYKRNIVDIFVSKETLSRALDVANKLFSALENRGHRVVLAPVDAELRRHELNAREGKQERQRYDTSGQWSGPARPTLLYVEGVAYGLTLFEISENVTAVYDRVTHDYVRLDGKKRRIVLPGEWTTDRWLLSGRLGLHVYVANRGVTWQKYWREEVSGDLPRLFEAVADDLGKAVPKIVQLKAEAEQEAVERQKEWEAECRERDRRDAERRREEEEQKRLEELSQQLEDWRFARDARALAEDVRAGIAARGLRITPDSPIDKWIRWVLDRAHDVDPLTPFRRDTEIVAEKHGIRPRPAHGPLGARLRQRRNRGV